MNITKEDISQEFRLKKKKRNKAINNYSIKETNQNKLWSNKSRKVYTTLNYIKQFLILVFAITICVSFSAFTSLIDIYKGIMSSANSIKYLCNNCKD